MDLTQGHKYTLQQKLSFTMLVVFGILIVVLGFLQMRNTIYTPFVIRSTDLAGPEVGALFESEQVKLQSIDTDHDGLNDYEELNFYSTSPYLPDSDSDGIEDKTEIVNHSDPNCPEGKKCQTAENFVTTSSPTFVSELGMQTGLGLDPGPAPDTSVSDVTGNLEVLSRDPAAMRKLMLQSGAISKEELDQVDDATILKMAQGLVEQQFGTSNTTTTVSSTTATDQ